MLLWMFFITQPDLLICLCVSIFQFSCLFFFFSFFFVCLFVFSWCRGVIGKLLGTKRLTFSTCDDLCYKGLRTEKT